MRDACGCDTGGDCECLCDAVAAYAQACLDKGVCVDWRAPDFCRECPAPPDGRPKRQRPSWVGVRRGPAEGPHGAPGASRPLQRLRAPHGRLPSQPSTAASTTHTRGRAPAGSSTPRRPTARGTTSRASAPSTCRASRVPTWKVRATEGESSAQGTDGSPGQVGGREGQGTTGGSGESPEPGGCNRQDVGGLARGSVQGGWGWGARGNRLCSPGQRPGRLRQRGRQPRPEEEGPPAPALRPGALARPSGCYNCSQDEYFDHAAGTCVPCSKCRRWAHSPHTPPSAPQQLPPGCALQR